MAEDTTTTTEETTTTTETTDTGDGGEPSFKPITSQEQFNRMTEERLHRERAKFRSQFADYDDLKSKAKKYDELEESQKDELQREREAREKAEREREEALSTARNTRIRSAVVAEAARQNAVDPEAVFRLLDDAAIEVDDNGEPTNVEAAVSGLLSERDYLLAHAGGGRGGNDPDLGARGGGTGKLSLEQYKALSAEEQRDAMRDGKVALPAAAD